MKDFRGEIRYNLSVLGGTSTTKDSMVVLIDGQKILVKLFLPDSTGVSETVFIDDLEKKRTYRIEKKTGLYYVDTLRVHAALSFSNIYSLGAVNRELCLRYVANLEGTDKINMMSAECLAAINYRTEQIIFYSFLGVQPVVVDNRIVMEYNVTRPDGSISNVTVTSIRKVDSLEAQFDLSSYREGK